MHPRPLRSVSVLLLLASFIGASNWAFAQENAEIAEREKAAVEKQIAEQKIAVRAVPFVSGFAFDGLDPESPASAGMFVVDQQGRAGLVHGKLNAESGNYEFTGVNEPAEGKGWLDQPVNRILSLGAFKWIAMSAAFGWPFVAFVLRGTMYLEEKHDSTLGAVFFRFVGWLANLLVLLILGFLYMLAIRRPELWPGAPGVELTHLLPLICGLVITTALSLLGVLIAWTKGYWRIPGRMHYSLTIVSAAAFLYYLYDTDVLTHFGR